MTIHKLIALGAVGLLGILVYQANQIASVSGIELTACVLTGLLFLGTIITGGLLSTDYPMPAAISTMHQVMPLLTVLSTIAALCLVLGAR